MRSPPKPQKVTGFDPLFRKGSIFLMHEVTPVSPGNDIYLAWGTGPSAPPDLGGDGQRRTQGGGGTGPWPPPFARKGGQHVFCPPIRQPDPFRQSGPLRPVLPFLAPMENFLTTKGPSSTPKGPFDLEKIFFRFNMSRIYRVTSINKPS